MDLSIIIINRNTKDMLDDCLGTIARGCTLDDKVLSYEIWVVDNGSTDGSQAMVREKYPEVLIIENTENNGFAAANNQALREAKGRCCLLLNSDTLVHEGAFVRMVQLMDDDPEVGMVGARLLNADGSYQNSMAPDPSLLVELGKKSLMKKINPKKYYGKRYQPSEPTAVSSVIGASLMIKSEVMQKVGFLDESYFFFLEETDWCLRVRKSGYKVMYHPHAEVTHLQGGTAKQVPVSVRIEYWRSRYTFFRKHRGWLTQLLLIVGLWIELWIDVVFFAITSLWKAKARRRLPIALALVGWHLLLCPQSWGLDKRM